MLSKTLPCLLAACAVLAGRPLAAQEYHSNDLTPAGAGSGKLTSSSSGRQVGGSQAPSSYSTHAVLLSGNALTAVDLNPAGAYYSMATCLDDAQEGGWAYLPTGLHATVWSGSAATAVDLNPSGYNFSYCLGLHQGEQVGYAQNQSYFITASHAYCWHGSATSGVDLHPGTAPFSRAYSCRNGVQVGYVSTIAYGEGEQLGYHTGSHAVQWAGTAASAIDLHPAGFDASEATCTNGLQTGGWGYLATSPSHLHALLWTGDAASVTDLHSAAYTETRLNALSDSLQAGEGWTGVPGAFGSVRHALVWSGTAESVMDLNAYLPAGYIHGVATGLDADGNVVGYAYNTFQAGVTIPQGAVAVVFAPGTAPAAQIASIALAQSNVAPGTSLQGTVSLGGVSPAGGVPITFLSMDPAVAATPAPLIIPEGETSAAFPLDIASGSLTAPTTFKIYATDGTVSRSTSLTVTPIVTLASVTGNTVEGGFQTSGTVALSIPAQTGGASISLTSGDPQLVAVPASLTIPQGYAAYSFLINTAAVTTGTTVPVTATYQGRSVTANVTLSPAPIVTLSGLAIPALVGGQSTTGTVTLNNFSRSSTGTEITLTSSDAGTLQVPARVVVPYGAYSVNFSVTSNVVNGSKGVSVQAAGSGSNLTTTVTVNPIPPITLVSADWDPDTLLFKVQANSVDATAILTYGTDSASGPIGTMQFELGVWKGSIVMNTAPSVATVWSSFGATASMPVTIKGVSSGGGGGGGKTGGGKSGGGGTATPSSTYKLSTSKTGKGTITISPAAATYAAGTVVTLTATPDAGSPWIGWTGSVVSKSQRISVTMNSNLSLTANFK